MTRRLQSPPPETTPSVRPEASADRSPAERALAWAREQARRGRRDRAVALAELALEKALEAPPGASPPFERLLEEILRLGLGFHKDAAAPHGRRLWLAIVHHLDQAERSRELVGQGELAGVLEELSTLDGGFPERYRWAIAFAALGDEEDEWETKRFFLEDGRRHPERAGRGKRMLKLHTFRLHRRYGHILNLGLSRPWVFLLVLLTVFGAFGR